MKENNDAHSIVGTILTEIEVLNEEIDLVPKIITGQMSYSQEIVFRPLTAEEKKEFIESLDDKGRQILEELAGAKS